MSHIFHSIEFPMRQSFLIDPCAFVYAPPTASVGQSDHSNASDFTIYTDNTYFFQEAASASGTVRYVHLYVTNTNGGGLAFAVSLADGSGNNLICASGTISSTGWVTLDSGTTYTVTASTNYYIAISGKSQHLGMQAAFNSSSVKVNFSGATTCPMPALTLPGAVNDNYPLAIVWDNSASPPS